MLSHDGVIPFLAGFCTVAAVYDRRQFDFGIVQVRTGNGITGFLGLFDGRKLPIPFRSEEWRIL
jgi:hypothetical protein